MNFIRKIMVLLLSLVALFTLGIWFMSSLNLDYSKEAMSELRLRQIKDAFYARLERINAHNDLIERNAWHIANLGEMFYRMHRKNSLSYNNEIEKILQQKIQNSPEVFGGGFWFEPHVYDNERQSFSPYAYWKKNQVVMHWAEADELYHEEEWYRTAIPVDWDLTQRRPERFYWSAARYNAVLEAVVITLSTPMYDDTGKLIGVATVDWGVNEIANLISDVQVTPNSFAFLLDDKNRKFTSLTKQEALLSQNLLAALSMKMFADFSWPSNFIEQRLHPDSMQSMEVEVDKRAYKLFFTKTQAGMIFGISVPSDEIHAALERLRKINLRIVLATVLSLLFFAALILYMVAGIMRLLDNLYTDRLTALPNRNKLLRDLQEEPCAGLVLINIDAFKELNDFYGHDCGDSILQRFAGELRKHLRVTRENVGGLKARLYRMPGDEFAVLLPQSVKEEQLESYMAKLCEFAAARMYLCEEQELNFTLTAGAAMEASSKTDQSGDENLLSYANMALQTAKKLKQQTLIYNPSMQIREEYKHNITWAKNLKNCLANNRLIPYFQPIMNTHTGKIEKYECLVRMIDREGDIVLPGEFLEVAKKLRLYHKITELMVDKSFRALRRIPGEFSINLSYQDLAHQSTTNFIKEKLEEYGIAEKVVFEILESESIQNYAHAHQFIKSVKNMGCKIAIDDFGTGYSNFEHLLKLNADFIKIDGSLIQNLHTDKNSLIVTQGIVDFARKLGMKTIAEYVHSQDVLDKVVEVGIDFAQGFHISPPLRTLKTPND